MALTDRRVRRQGEACTKCQGADKDKPLVGPVIAEDGKLKVRGYLGPFYKTQTWLKGS